MVIVKKVQRSKGTDAYIILDEISKTAKIIDYVEQDDETQTYIYLSVGGYKNKAADQVRIIEGSWKAVLFLFEEYADPFDPIHKAIEIMELDISYKVHFNNLSNKRRVK